MTIWLVITPNVRGVSDAFLVFSALGLDQDQRSLFASRGKCDNRTHKPASVIKAPKSRKTLGSVARLNVTPSCMPESSDKTFEFASIRWRSQRDQATVLSVVAGFKIGPQAPDHWALIRLHTDSDGESCGGRAQKMELRLEFEPDTFCSQNTLAQSTPSTAGSDVSVGHPHNRCVPASLA